MAIARSFTYPPTGGGPDTDNPIQMPTDPAGGAGDPYSGPFPGQNTKFGVDSNSPGVDFKIDAADGRARPLDRYDPNIPETIMDRVIATLDLYRQKNPVTDQFSYNMPIFNWIWGSRGKFPGGRQLTVFIRRKRDGNFSTTPMTAKSNLTGATPWRSCRSPTVRSLMASR